MTKYDVCSPGNRSSQEQMGDLGMGWLDVFKS